MGEPIEQITRALIKVDTKILELLYKDLAQPGVQKVGKCLSTVFGLGNTVLLPLKLINEKANTLYTKHMEAYRTKLEQIPEKELVEVEPEIGVPILENLEKTSNETLSSLYINLLVNASDIKYAGDTHPRFVKIIENIAPDEAKILEFLDEHKNIQKTIPFVTLRIHMKFDHPSIPQKTGLIDSYIKTTDLEYNEILRLPNKAKEYFENIVGLGLIECVTDKFSQGNVYDKILQHLDSYIKEQNQITHVTRVEIKKGYYQLSRFGKSFIRACTPKK